MTQQQKRIKLAKYAFIQIPDQKWALVKPLPDYFNDFNAVHELEKVLLENFGMWKPYVTQLKIQSAKSKIPLFHLSAIQRAEAIGLTLNLWNA
jgi:hypothetical protein